MKLPCKAGCFHPHTTSQSKADLSTEMDKDERSGILFKWATFEVRKFQEIKRSADRPIFWALPLIPRQNIRNKITVSDHKFSSLGTSKETDFSLYLKAKQGDLTFSYPLLIYGVHRSQLTSFSLPCFCCPLFYFNVCK